jgi:2-octaprenyl-6-methoxyphenol hydroxylase
MTNHDYDILIIGGGLVGASLSVALSGRGLRIGLVEAVAYGDRAQPSYDDRTIALSYGSHRIFDGLGLWPAIAASATPIRRIHISDRGRFGAARLDAAEAGVTALGYVAESRALGAALAARLTALPDITLTMPARMTGLELKPEAAEVTIQQGDATRVLRARLVVAADGGDSPARSAAGLEAQRVDYHQTAVITNITPDQPHDEVAFERFTPHGPIAFLPMRDNRCAVVWSLPPEAVERVLALDDDAFRAELGAAFGDRLGAIRRVGRRAAYPLRLTRVPEQVRERLVLIGNAAHTLHPVAGQGFNLGLRDVAWLAEEIIDAQARGEDFGTLAVLERYRARRRNDNLAIAGFTDLLVHTFSNDRAPVALARDLGLLAVDLCLPVKRGLLRLTMGQAGRQPRLARGVAL